MFKSIAKFTTTGIIMLGLAACGSSAPSTPTATPKPAAVPITIEIASKGEELAFTQTQLEVNANARITLKFSNSSAAQQHNWVLVQPGQADSVATDGIGAGEANNYVVNGDTRVIASTKLAKPKETVEVVFDAPTPGSYPFICTFPGHATVMRGILIVK